MTIEEFEICEVPFGWKDEYCDGFAYITPRQHGVLMKISVEKRKVESVAELKPISEINNAELIELFFDSFVDSVEYLNEPEQTVRKKARREIANFFKGRRGIPQIEFCKVAIVDNLKVGACLVSKYKYGYKNEIIFVHPNFQQRRIGSLLVSAVINDLSKIGEQFLWSEHHICNELSANWHRKFGFVEVTDILTAKFRANFYRHEFYRYEKKGDQAKLAYLKPLLENAKKEIERLNNIEKDDFDAAWMSWRYDF